MNIKTTKNTLIFETAYERNVGVEYLTNKGVNGLKINWLELSTKIELANEEILETCLEILENL